MDANDSSELLKMLEETEVNSSAVQVQEIEAGIVQVTMQDRANKNTFSIDLIVGLFRAFQSIQENPDYKAVILTGYDNYFACGGGQDAMEALNEGRMTMTDVNIYSLPMDCPIPVIAAMQGHGIGGGLCFGLYSDFIVMSKESSYTCNHMKYGFTPGDGASLILPERLGASAAQEMLFTGNRYRGSELQARGATVPIVPKKEVLPYALKLARDLAEVPRESLVLFKQHMNESICRRLQTTLEKEWEMQQKTFVNKPEVMQKILSAFDQGATKQEPELNSEHSEELLLLNRGGQGRPVFWVHGDGGGVEGYQVFAQKSVRPFYGIQARGRMNDKAPLFGIEAMAAYYVELIRSVQPEGPYDLGGYSLGGVLIYEMARQLQAAEQAVHSLVMLDTLDSNGRQQVNLSKRGRLLQAVNLSLLSRIRQEPDKLFKKLIHQQELQEEWPEEEVLKHLIALGRSRGLSITKSEEELRSLFEKNLQIQEAFAIEQYVLEPLPDPKAVICYYFRNHSRSFYGEFQPYLTTSEEQATIDQTDYWLEWEQSLPHCHMVDVESSNHFSLLFEPAASETIAAFCGILYNK